MTKGEALYQFFSSFDLPAYPANAVPVGAEFPYLTYDAAYGSWEQGELNITVNLWYDSTGEVIGNAKQQEISKAIGYGGYLISCDGGSIWLKRGKPWCQSLYDPTDNKIKRWYINVTVEYLTRD